MKKIVALLTTVILISSAMGQDVEQDEQVASVTSAVSAAAAPIKPSLTEEQHQELGNILIQLKLLDTLPANKETNEARESLLDETGPIIGTRARNTSEVQKVYDLGPTSWSRNLGSYITFINVLWVFVGLIFLVAFLGLFGEYLWPLVKNLPPELLEFVAWIVCLAAAFISPSYWNPVPSFIAAMVSIPFVAGLAAYRIWEDSWRTHLAIMTIFVGAAAIVHSSIFFGTISVATLLWLCGSWVVPIIGDFDIFSDREYAPSTFASSGVMLLVTGILGMTSNPEWLGVFKYGVFWLAGTSFCGALLTMSCRYYYGNNQNWANWLFWQIIAVACGIGALYAGHMYAMQLDSTVLQEIGGTFLGIYMILKIAELPWDFKHWPWIALIIAIGGYFAVDFAAAHPAYFLAF